MADEKPKTVKVEATQWHTYNGTEYNIGDVYDIDERLVDTIVAQGKALPADQAAEARKAAQAAKTMTTADVGVKKPK